ncbi:protein of unknown function [Burkholderia multivorans]
MAGFIGGDIFRDSVNSGEPHVRLPGMSDATDMVMRKTIAIFPLRLARRHNAIPRRKLTPEP